jgi:hypothetical protein
VAPWREPFPVDLSGEPDRGAGVAEFHRDRDLVQVHGDGAEFRVVIVAVHTEAGRFFPPRVRAIVPKLLPHPPFRAIPPARRIRPGATGSAALI